MDVDILTKLDKYNFITIMKFRIQLEQHIIFYN